MGKGRENLFEFTEYGGFVAFRWISRATGGEKYQVSEVGTYSANGGNLKLEGFRRNEFSKELTYSVEGTVLKMGDPRLWQKARPVERFDTLTSRPWLCYFLGAAEIAQLVEQFTRNE